MPRRRRRRVRMELVVPIPCMVPCGGTFADDGFKPPRAVWGSCSKPLVPTSSLFFLLPPYRRVASPSSLVVVVRAALFCVVSF